MPLIFSPVDLSELRDPFSPRPKSAFLMLQLGGTIAGSEIRMRQLVSDALTDRGIAALTTEVVSGTGDYLKKIVDLLRACGFGFAIFSDVTPARSLANIFFEVGVAGILGKPVQLLLAGAAPPPSDFVRTEWIRFDEAHENQFLRQLSQALGTIGELAEYYRKLELIALHAQTPDLEEAFERFKQAILIGDDVDVRKGIATIRDLLKNSGRKRNAATDSLSSHRDRLLRAVTEFIDLLPAPRRPRSARKR